MCVFCAWSGKWDSSADQTQKALTAFPLVRACASLSQRVRPKGFEPLTS